MRKNDARRAVEEGMPGIDGIKKHRAMPTKES
jgi:hypothetical protein